MTYRPVPTLSVPVVDGSQPGDARRVAVSLADRLGFGEIERGEVAIVVTEMATNLVKHAAAGGQLLLRPFDEMAGSGLEVLSLDRGPGIADVARCMADGYSTAGSHGHGLGAIVRLSDAFEIHSELGSGTAVLARFHLKPPSHFRRVGMEFGAVNLPISGEEVCGDAWDVDDSGDRCRILVVDGLGHGVPASDASVDAVRIFRERKELALGDLVRAIHEALRSTRGAALAIAEIERDALRFVGVGNIAASIHQADRSRQQNLVSHNGTVGHQMRKVQEFNYSWAEGSLLVMHSDGLSTQWRLENYAGLPARHPGVVAGVLYRDFARGRDDVTVVAARPRREGTP